jgi:hypothetical protein
MSSCGGQTLSLFSSCVLSCLRRKVLCGAAGSYGLQNDAEAKEACHKDAQRIHRHRDGLGQMYDSGDVEPWYIRTQ